MLDHLQWPDPLESLVEELEHFTKVVVIDETESTQDALVRLDPIHLNGPDFAP